MVSGDNDKLGRTFCRKCGYDLRAQVAPHRCPECGRNFDPADRKTFLTRPPRGSAWRWARRIILALVLLGLLPALGWGWLYRDWKKEQAAVLKLGHIYVKVSPLGGVTLKRHLGSAGWVLDRADRAILFGRTADANLACLKDLKALRELDLRGTQVGEAGLLHLKELKGIERLHVRVLVDDAGLVHVKQLRGLCSLNLDDTEITDAGLAQLTGLKELEHLDLCGTQISDAGVVHLKELKGLGTLCLTGSLITEDGAEELRAALPGLRLMR